MQYGTLLRPGRVLLFQWRDQTFEVAKANVRVNGVEADEASGEDGTATCNYLFQAALD